MAYMVIRQYKIDPSNVAEVVQRAEQGFIPMVKRAPGLIRYLIARGDDGAVYTFSIFESRAQAEESSQQARGWIRDNLGELVPNPPQVTGGEVQVSHVIEGEPMRFGAMRRYRSVKDVAEAARRVEDGLVPILSKLPGFASYVVVDPGDGGVISLTAFRDRAAAEQSSQEASSWVRQNIAELVSEAPEVTTGEIMATVAP